MELCLFAYGHIVIIQIRTIDVNDNERIDRESSNRLDNVQSGPLIGESLDKAQCTIYRGLPIPDQQWTVLCSIGSHKHGDISSVFSQYVRDIPKRGVYPLLLSTSPASFEKLAKLVAEAGFEPAILGL
jgi:hypothetical protein